jgi:conjugal transfer pilus assembly protein TraB
MSQSLKDRWAALTPETKQRAVMVGSLVGLVTLIAIGTSSSDAPPTLGQRTAPPTAQNILMSKDPRELGLSSVAQDVNQLNDRLTQLEQENERLRSSAGRNPSMTPERAEIAALRQQIAALQQGGSAGQAGSSAGQGMAPGQPGGGIGPGGLPSTPSTPSAPGAPGAGVPGMGGQGGSIPAAPPPPPPLQIRTVVEPPPPVVEATAATERPVPKTYIPSGSIFSGVILTGVDAPTGRSASANPLPVLIRIQHEAILPSRYRADVREAFVLGEAFGDLSSERVYIRAQQISMVLANGKVVDRPIQASAVGSDGSAGLRGRLVSKQGAMIAKALLAGFADGASRAFANNSAYGFSGGGGIDPGQVAVGGFSGGASTALDRVASYFLAQADAAHPVVELPPGRGVSMILLRGFELDLAN